MDLEAVEKEVASWAPEEQDRLAAFLTVLRLKRTPDHVQELTRRLDDRDPTHWLGLKALVDEAARRRLAVLRGKRPEVEAVSRRRPIRDDAQ